MSNYYDNGAISSVEKATLAEDIVLPSITKAPLTLSFLEGGGSYKTAETEYKDTKGKFFISIMTPLVDQTNASTVSKASPTTRGQSGSKLNASKYSSSNYVTLTIPKYILLNFTGTVPKGTEFLVASINGSSSISNMRIIGIY